jgi:hypothetical protein
MYTPLKLKLEKEIQEITDAGLYKKERSLPLRKVLLFVLKMVGKLLISVPTII